MKLSAYQKTFTFNDKLRIPQETEPGNYFLLVFIDYSNQFQETNEGNNISYKNINVYEDSPQEEDPNNNADAVFSIWPDTGQTKCYDNSSEIPCPAPAEPFYGQDAQYQGPARSYTKLGANGVELPDSATPADGWIMTRDNVTGLIWEIKTDGGGIHDKDNTYTWCDHNPATNGGNAGTCGEGTDTEDFINTLNSAHFGGYSDWRLPTVKELSTLVNINISYPVPDIAYFPGTGSAEYWSSTTYAYDAGRAWRVNFSHGGVVSGYRNKNNVYSYVRAVRSGQTTSSLSFVDNHDGTITDKATGLVWQKCSMGQTYNASTNGCDGSANSYTWQSALAECESLALAGHDDWRLPSRNELQSIVDYSRYNLAIDTVYFPNTASSWYWSSTTHANSAGSAWRVSSGDGDVYGYGKYSNGYVRAVRSGQGGSVGNSVNLVISRTGTGSGTVTSSDGGISCGSDCSETYDKDTSITLTASSNSNSYFAGWTGDCEQQCGSSSMCDVVMNVDMTCTAEFASIPMSIGADLIPPIDLSASDSGGNTLLSWSAPSVGTPAKYLIFRKVAGEDDFVLIDKVDASTLKYQTNDSYRGEIRYIYAVASEDVSGNRSILSDTVMNNPVSSISTTVGDVSGDDKINIVDALFVARYAVKLPVSNFNANAADVNCDGSVNIVDALLIARKAVGLPVSSWCGSGK